MLITTEMPITLIMECRSPSGHSIRKTTTIKVEKPQKAELSTDIKSKTNDMKTMNQTQLESELTSLSSMIPSMAETLDLTEIQTVINDLVNTMSERQKEIGSTSKIQNTKLLSNEIRWFDKSSTITLANVLASTVKESNISRVWSDVISATNNFASVMVGEKSDQEQKKAFTDLLSQVTGEVRSLLQPGEQKRLSLSNVEVVMAMPSNTSANANATLSIPVPNTVSQGEQLQPQPVSQDKAVVVQVKASDNQKGQSPEISAQGQIISNPQETYTTKCDSRLVSPIVSVQLFRGTEKLITTAPATSDNDDTDVTVVTSTIMEVTEDSLSSVNSTLYSLVCKYFNEANVMWMVDTRVCTTMTVPRSASVTCLCHAAVTHAVSLDYVQSATVDEGKKSNDASSCLNPCGCPARTKLKSWIIAIIAVSGATDLAVVLVVVSVMSYIVIVKLYKPSKDVSPGPNALQSSPTTTTTGVNMDQTRDSLTRNPDVTDVTAARVTGGQRSSV